MLKRFGRKRRNPEGAMPAGYDGEPVVESAAAGDPDYDLRIVNVLPPEWAGETVFALALKHLRRAMLPGFSLFVFLALVAFGFAGAGWWMERASAAALSGHIADVTERFESYRTVSEKLRVYRSYAALKTDPPMAWQAEEIMSLVRGSGMALEGLKYHAGMPKDMMGLVGDPFVVETQKDLKSVEVSGVWVLSIIADKASGSGALDNSWGIESNKRLGAAFAPSGWKTYLFVVRSDKSRFVKFAEVGVLVWR